MNVEKVPMVYFGPLLQLMFQFVPKRKDTCRESLRVPTERWKVEEKVATPPT